MKIVIFSDVHYSTQPKISHGVERKLTALAVPLATQLVDKINSIKPDMVVNLGDMIEDLRDEQKDIQNIKTIWRVFEKINAPFYYVCGNHDLRGMNRATFTKTIGYDNLTYSVDLGGCHFVSLSVGDEEYVCKSGHKMKRTIPQEDLDWLKRDIAKNKLPSIVFIHQGVAEDDMRGNFWFEHDTEAGLLQNREELKEILKTDKNLIAVFSAHQHWTKSITEDGIHYHTIGSITENLNNDGRPDGVWFEVDINGKTAKIKEHHL